MGEKSDKYQEIAGGFNNRIPVLLMASVPTLLSAAVLSMVVELGRIPTSLTAGESHAWPAACH